VPGRARTAIAAVGLDDEHRSVEGLSRPGQTTTTDTPTGTTPLLPISWNADGEPNLRKLSTASRSVLQRTSARKPGPAKGAMCGTEI
jgi:hypothetical protein